MTMLGEKELALVGGWLNLAEVFGLDNAQVGAVEKYWARYDDREGDPTGWLPKGQTESGLGIKVSGAGPKPGYRGERTTYRVVTVRVEATKGKLKQDASFFVRAVSDDKLTATFYASPSDARKGRDEYVAKLEGMSGHRKPTWNSQILVSELEAEIVRLKDLLKKAGIEA